MEKDSKEVVEEIVTKDSFLDVLRNLGVKDNKVIEVHSSLSSLGYVVGGARTIVDALLELTKDNGTILMPIQTTDNTDPSGWQNPPLAPSLWQQVRDAMPAYHPEASDLRNMGAIPENFRHRNGVIFSGHPSVSYAAWGKYAHLLCNRQSLHFPLAEESPAARLYELRGDVLLIGVDYDTCTCMHLAEYKTDCRPIQINCSSVKSGDGKVWKKYLDLDIDSSIFNKIGSQLEEEGLVKQTKVGDCVIKYFSAVDAIDKACSYFEKTSIIDLYR